MNFDKIFFRLLIIKTLYQCSLGVPTEIAPLSEITVINHGFVNYTSARFGQYEGEDRFSIVDSDNTLYETYFGGDFSSNMIEFTNLYGVEMDFLLQRRDEQIVWFKCVFSEKKFIQAFFRKIYSYKEKGESVVIFRIARYSINSQQVERFVKHGNLHVKDTASITFEIVKKTYHITHLLDSDGTTEVDLIFQSKIFAISSIYKFNKIALCILDYPDERFLLRFTSNKDAMTAESMLADMRHDDLHCPFPRDLTNDQLFYYLDEP